MNVSKQKAIIQKQLLECDDLASYADSNCMDMLVKLVRQLIHWDDDITLVKIPANFRFKKGDIVVDQSKETMAVWRFEETMEIKKYTIKQFQEQLDNIIKCEKLIDL